MKAANGFRLQALGIGKSFGGNPALNEVDLRLRGGSVHALFGINGAGKSTMVKIITGVYQPDAGEIRLNGEPVSFASPADARDAGIAVVYQDPPLFGHLSVAENMFVGAYPRTAHGLVDWIDARATAQRVLESLYIDLDPGRPVQELSAAEREFVAIARALQHDSQVLILDEPTAALTPEETRRLFDVLREYRGAGGSVLFITHRIDEALEIADEATVFRNGITVFTGAVAEISHDRIVEEMLGRALESALSIERRATTSGSSAPAVALRVRGLTVPGRFADVSFDVHEGEIVALAGLVGAGRTEVVETIVGLRRQSAGEIELGGHRLGRRSPRRMAERGVVLVPEDRDTDGLISGFSVAENIAMPNEKTTSRFGFLDPRAERRLAAEEVEALQIHTDGVTADVASLSGGNRQKVVLAKWLAREPRVLLLDEPTKGVDVGAKLEIHQLMRELARQRGVAILMVTSDFDEVVGLADRILVMRGGRLVGQLEGGDITEEGVLSLASTSTLAGSAGEPAT